jgi:hypothetical protein
MAQNIENIKHGEYLIELMQTGKSMYEQVEYLFWGVRGAVDLKGSNFCMGQGVLTKPMKMGGETHSHDFDQVLLFIGADPRNIRDFDAEIEMFLGDKFESFDYPTCIHIPAGTIHAPVIVKRVNKPILYADITLAPIVSEDATRHYVKK